MLISKHALLVLNPCELRPRSAKKAAEIKEPKKVEGPKDILQASSKEPDQGPTPVESSYNFSITYQWMLDASPRHLTSDFRVFSF